MELMMRASSTREKCEVCDLSYLSMMNFKLFLLFVDSTVAWDAAEQLSKKPDRDPRQIFIQRRHANFMREKQQELV